VEIGTFRRNTLDSEALVRFAIMPTPSVELENGSTSFGQELHRGHGQDEAIKLTIKSLLEIVQTVRMRVGPHTVRHRV
jgi:hypothetical protein